MQIFLDDFPPHSMENFSWFSIPFDGPSFLLLPSEQLLLFFLSNLIAFRVIQLIVPDKLDAGDELLELEADVEGEGDDVVVEHHPQQQHLQDAHEGDVVHLDIV